MQYFERAGKMMAIQEKFIQAVINSDLDMVTKLFDVEPTTQEPNPLVPDVNGEIQDNPLILYAAKKQDWKMVDELFFRGANIDVCDVSHGWYLVNEVILNASEKLFTVFIKEFNMDVATRDGDSPLMIALKNDKFDRAEFLLANTGVHYSTVNSKKENVGHEAIRKGRYDFFIDLVKAGMSYNLKNKEGKTPLDLLDNLVMKDTLEKKIEELKNQINVRESANGKYVKKDEEIEAKTQETVSVKKNLSGLSKIKRA